MTGSIVTFDDAIPFMPIESIVAQIEPVQDLHGQDAPWPAGGGKNRLKITATSTTINGITYTVNEDGTIVANGTASNISNFVLVNGFGIFNFDGEMILNGSVSGFDNNVRTRFGVSSPAATYDDFGNGVTIPQISDISTRYAYVQITINSGTTVNNIVFKPMIRLASVTDPTFAPYSNICPISGWTGMNGQRTGVNVWDEEWEVGAISSSTGQNQANNTVIRSKNYIPVKPGTNIYIKSPNQAGSAAGNLSARYYTKDKTYIGYQPPMFVGTVVTIPDNCYYIRFNTQQSYGTTYNHDISINYPSTDTSYHAYTGESLSVSWQDTAGTVYGGTITVEDDGSGELVADRVSQLFDENSGWIKSSTNRFDVFVLDNKSSLISKWDLGKSVIGNQTEVVRNSTGVENGVRINITQTQIRYSFTPYGTTTLETFKSYIASNNLQLVTYLATPLVYHFDSLEHLTTLIGTNNVWVDTGDVTVTYQSTTSRSEYIVGMIGRAIEVFDENTELPENTSDVLEKTIDVFDEHEVEKIDNPLLKNTIELYDPKEIDESEKPEDTFNDTVDIFD